MDRLLTDEQRRQMVGLLPFSPNEKIRYTPDFCRSFPEDFIPVFVIMGPTREDANRLSAAFQASDKDDVVIDILNKYVVGWENLYDVGTCKCMPFTKAEDLPQKYLNSLAIAIAGIAGIVDVEKLGLRF